MRQYAGTLNRTWLGIIGVALLLGGLYVVLAWTGVVPGPAQTSPVVSPDVASRLGESWAAVVIVALGAILVVLALLWLVAQIPRTNAGRPLRLQDDAARGLTVCDPNALGQAVEDDLTSLAGVRSADAVLRGSAKEPELTVRVGVDDRADIQGVLRDIRTDVAGHLSTAMDTPLALLAVRFDVERGKRSTDSINV